MKLKLIHQFRIINIIEVLVAELIDHRVYILGCVTIYDITSSSMFRKVRNIGGQKLVWDFHTTFFYIQRVGWALINQ